MTTTPTAKGSKHNICEYIARPELRARLDAGLQAQLPALAGASIEWLSPLAPERRELRDVAFWHAIDRADLQAAAKTWWPSKGGPVWDAVAIATQGDERTVVLIEAKAHPGEFVGSGATATAQPSKDAIKVALGVTHERLRATVHADAWIGPHYQLANRLTWTDWLRDHGQPAVFAYVAFADDTTHIPAPESALRNAAGGSFTALGLTSEALPEWCTIVVLPAA